MRLTLSALRGRLWWIHRRFQDVITMRTKHGRLTFSLRDYAIGRELYVHGQYEFDSSVAALRFLQQQKLVPSGATIMDVGANIGLIGIGLVRSGLASRVLAVEPEPSNFALLLRNIAQNGLSEQILPAQFAMGTGEGTVRMELDRLNPGDHRIRVDHPATAERHGESQRRTIDVPMVPVDSLFSRLPHGAPRATDVDLVWVDIQGYEGHFFLGGDHLFGRGIPTVAEVWPYGILRAGLTLEEFAAITARYWTHFWREADDGFTAHPVSDLHDLMLDLRRRDVHENVIFTRSP